MNALTTTLTHVPRFTLGPEITPEQRAFLDRWGFLIFAGVASPDEIAALAAALDEVQARWIAEGRRWVYGIPLTVGKDSAGGPFVQRFAFTSMFSETVRNFVRDQRFEPVRRLVGEDARIGDDEKDGVVVNRYLNNPGSEYPRLGWHTDGLRDLFYLRMPQQMLNVGLHFDEITADNGGLRLIPGSHNQGFMDMCFRKLYFLQHAPDPAEIAVETMPGDLTVHDGRLWHRVAASTRVGPTSLRRSMYVPYLSGPYEPKSDTSGTPFYHHVGRGLRWLRRAVRG
ncbi:MAG: phytanoyl-CoA dioxygenase family protein [Deltaproteobacteria bacterium]|nr:phytanoyl-CoA dioxygenase family protein [Deltaproteobacteria bacterium]